MSLVCMGASYKTAPIAVRERIALAHEDIPAALAELADGNGIKECLILSTCNRIEAYVDAKTDRMGIDALTAFYERRAGVPLPEGAFFLERGMAAATHLFRVVCSLDSQVLGEAQILGQTRGAFEDAVAAGTCTDVLMHLFKDALHLGKRARAETAIGQDSVSLSTTAFNVARRAFPDLPDRRVMFVGAGEMARLASTYLTEAGVNDIVVSSRSREHARALVEACGGRVCADGSFYEELACADVVFSMTSSRECVICADELSAARDRAGMQGRACVIIDEAVPRDVEDACADIDGVRLYNLEALASIVDEGMAERVASVGDVERLIAEAEESFFAWMQQRNVVPTIKAIYAKGEAAVDAELSRAMRSLTSVRGEEVSDDERAVLEAFGSSIMKKILHGPTIRLRKESSSADSYYYTGAARYLFGIETFPLGTHHHACGTACRSGLPCPVGVDESHREVCSSRGIAHA